MLYTNSGRKIPMIGLLISSISLVLSTLSGIGQSPWRWPLFFTFTIGQAVPVGFISSLYAYETVIKAMTVTSAVTGSITLYTLLQKNPKYDLSQWGRSLAGRKLCIILFLTQTGHRVTSSLFLKHKHRTWDGIFVIWGDSSSRNVWIFTIWISPIQ